MRISIGFCLLCVTFFLPICSKFYTIEGYKALSDDQRQTLHSEAMESLVGDRLPAFGHPLARPSCQDSLIDFAQELIDEYPNDTLCGLGQSPAYLIEIMQRL